MLSIETVFSYAKLGAYATSFHRLSAKKENSLLLEIRVVITRIITTVLSGAFAAYVTYIAFDGLEGKALVAAPPATLLNVLELLLQMVYWATTTFSTVGYGDISPANGLGQLVAFLIEVQALAVLGIVFASLFASRGQTPT
jgi:hypothetical protein